MLLEICAALFLGAVILFFALRRKEESLSLTDDWWGEDPKPASGEDETVHPFKVQTSREVIDDLFRRIDQNRLTDALKDSKFNYGFNSAYMHRVISYWKTQFDWEKQVSVLNQFPHFKTKIEGISVHFIHVKPSGVPEGKSVKPLLMVHGWPGSFYEFYKIIPLLTDPTAHGLKGEIIFEVICPSIPGYGFSEAPHKQGFNSEAAARIFYKLMLRLGFTEFYVQGGDWGSLICTVMSQLVPSHVKGLHVNMAGVTDFSLSKILSIMFGQYFPSLFGFHEEDVNRLYPFMEKGFYNMMKESGYFHLQATKPDTAGFALNDSPVGLAAYILEKFSTWTNKDYRDLDDGGLERHFSLDDLLTNVMLYWVNGCITPSMRFYKENMGKGLGTQKHEKMPVRVPTGIAAFPHELLHVPRSWAKKKFLNIVSYNYMHRGGHFAAFEEPKLLAEDIQHFVHTVENK